MSVSRLLSLAAVAFAGLTSSACLGSGSSINAYGGTRFLEADEFDDLDNPVAYGGDVVLATKIPWVGIEGGWFHSEDDTDTAGLLTDVELDVDEYFVGVRLTPWTFLIAPYGSVGATYVDSAIDSTTTSDDDDVVAFYARLGAAMTFGLFRFGVDGRATFGSDVELDTIESDVDGYQLMGFVGLAF